MDVPRELGTCIASDCQFLMSDTCGLADRFRFNGLKTVNDDGLWKGEKRQKTEDGRENK